MSEVVKHFADQTEAIVIEGINFSWDGFKKTVEDNLNRVRVSIRARFEEPAHELFYKVIDDLQRELFETWDRYDTDIVNHYRKIEISPNKFKIYHDKKLEEFREKVVTRTRVYIVKLEKYETSLEEFKRKEARETILTNVDEENIRALDNAMRTRKLTYLQLPSNVQNLIETTTGRKVSETKAREYIMRLGDNMAYETKDVPGKHGGKITGIKFRGEYSEKA